MNPIYQHYLVLKGEQPNKYARDLAALIGISEAELCEARIGVDAVALKRDFPALLKALGAVGETKNITRNAYAVHEHLGEYHNVQIGAHGGLVLNPCARSAPVRRSVVQRLCSAGADRAGRSSQHSDF
ncbi:putative heme degradation protein [Pantoea agglomerans]|nr:putative heme degradation protein [Pantoea agglomerans]MBA8893309.1 putative heme degradation protein [Pantoea agglomerans]